MMKANLTLFVSIKCFVIAAVAVILSSAVFLIPAAAQLDSTAGGSWHAPRLPDGQPDLQGNWTNATLTPFERPENQSATMTREEAAALESDNAQYVAERDLPSEPDRPLPTGGNDPVCIDGATTCYNEAWREPGDLIAVVNGEPRTSLITSPADGRIPALTAAAQRRAEEYYGQDRGYGPYDHPESRPLAERCIVSFASSAGPPMIPNYWYNNNYTIVQNSDYVMIMAEMVHDVRIIRLGESTSNSPGESMRPWFGESWGRWEGDTLVVETTNMNPKFTFLEVPRSGDGKIIERFTRVGEESILYEFTVDDPSNYTSEWGGQIPFAKFSDPIYEYACHEGNYALANVLAGARYEDSRAED